MKNFQKNFQILVTDCINAHSRPVKPSKAVRKWDGETPYSVHPIWCAMMILRDGSSEDISADGSQALLFHDVLEDTLAELPDYLSASGELVSDMTLKARTRKW